MRTHHHLILVIRLWDCSGLNSWKKKIFLFCGHYFLWCHIVIGSRWSRGSGNMVRAVAAGDCGIEECYSFFEMKQMGFGCLCERWAVYSRNWISQIQFLPITLLFLFFLLCFAFWLWWWCWWWYWLDGSICVSLMYKIKQFYYFFVYLTSYFFWPMFMPICPEMDLPKQKGRCCSITGLISSDLPFFFFFGVFGTSCDSVHLEVELMAIFLAKQKWGRSKIDVSYSFPDFGFLYVFFLAVNRDAPNQSFVGFWSVML